MPPSAIIAAGLPANDLPVAPARPALALQAQELAREQGALLIAWPRWGTAVLTPAAPPLGLVAGGLGLLLPPDELVVPPAQAAPLANTLAALLAQPSLATASAASVALATLDSPEAALWQVVVAGWAAALARDWDQLEAACRQAAVLAERSDLPGVTRGGARLAVGLLLLEAGEAPQQAETWLAQAAADFARLGQDAAASLARWAQAQAAAGQGRASEAEQLAQQALATISPAQAPVIYAVVQAGLASLWLTHSPARYAEAIEQLEAAARACPLATNPLLAARLLATLGDTLQARASDDATLEHALTCYQQAATLFSKSGTPEDLAAVRMNQGSTLQGLSANTRANLLKAIDCYHQALRVFTLDTHPADYALIHNNLATAYLNMPMGGERDVMRQALAVQSMQEALKVYTIEEYPHEYAMVQNNLGNTLQYMPSGDRVEKLDRAIGAYIEALRVRSRARAPLEYATTLSNMANAYANLPAEDRGEVLAIAARAYHEALDIFREYDQDARAETVVQALAVVERELGV